MVYGGKEGKKERIMSLGRALFSMWGNRTCLTGGFSSNLLGSWGNQATMQVWRDFFSFPPSLTSSNPPFSSPSPSILSTNLD